MPEARIAPAMPSPPELAPLVQTEKPPTDLGRGGEQHKAIQKRIREAAQRLGYLVTAEKAVLDRSGSVDLALESGTRRIAVEITVTTTVDHELGNVFKCLKADFESVAVISPSEAKLAQIREAVVAALGPLLSARVSYYLPDPFIAHLESLAKADTQKAPSLPKEKVSRGFKVTRSAAKLTPEEFKAKEEAGLRMLAERMKPKGPGRKI